MTGNKNNPLSQALPGKPTASVISGHPDSRRSSPARFPPDTGRLSGFPGTWITGKGWRTASGKGPEGWVSSVWAKGLCPNPNYATAIVACVRAHVPVCACV